jgi:hypothetical protein
MKGAGESSAGTIAIKNFVKLGQVIPKLKLAKTLHDELTSLVIISRKQTWLKILRLILDYYAQT